jgi:hypothetical protein
MENVNVAMESMIKKIRTGHTYHCGAAGNLGIEQDCPVTGTGESAFAFQNYDGYKFLYRLCDGRIEVRKDLVGTGFPNKEDCNDKTGFRVMTSPEIEIRSLKFYVEGSGSGLSDLEQARVIITISGFADIPGKSQFDTEFKLQTMVSKRVFDLF